MDLEWQDVDDETPIVTLFDVESATRRILAGLTSPPTTSSGVISLLEKELGPHAIAYHSAVIAILSEHNLRTSASTKGSRNEDDDSDLDVPLAARLAAKGISGPGQPPSSSSSELRKPAQASKPVTMDAEDSDGHISVGDSDRSITKMKGLGKETRKASIPGPKRAVPATPNPSKETPGSSSSSSGTGAGAGGEEEVDDAGKGQRGTVKLASSLPLMLSKTLFSSSGKSRATMLVQIEDSSALDLSGDVGAIGRLTALPGEGLLLDLKGHQYAGTIVPCASFMVVGFGPTEARVESLVNDFVQVEHLSNVLAALAGNADPALLSMEDVGESEGAAVLRRRGDDEDDDGEGGAGAGSKRKRKDEEQDEEEENEEEAGASKAKMKRGQGGEAAAQKVKGAFGRTVQVGGRKKKKATKAKGKVPGKAKHK